MAKIEAVILDWAGTAIDYGSFAPVQAFLEVFRQYGLDPTMEETRAPMGMLKVDHIRTMLHMPRLTGQWEEIHGNPFDETDILAMHDLFAEKLLASLACFTEPNPYVLDTVKYLREQGIKLGSTTGYTDSMMAIVVPEAAKRGYRPDCWFSPDGAGGRGRPYPYMIFRNLETLGVSSVQAAVKVGDTVADIQEGIHAGVWTVGVLEGSSVLGLTQGELAGLDEFHRHEVMARGEALYKAHGAHYVIQNLAQLPEIIEALERQ